MASLQRLKRELDSTFGLRPSAAEVSSLRVLCLDLLADVPATRREPLLQQLDRMRRADDAWHLRSLLFEVISMTHCQQVASERLQLLDAKLP